MLRQFSYIYYLRLTFLCGGFYCHFSVRLISYKQTREMGRGQGIPFLTSHPCHKTKTEHGSSRRGTHTGWVGTVLKDGDLMKLTPKYWFPSAVLLPCPSMEPTLTVLPVSGCGSHSGAPPCRLSVGDPVIGWHGLLAAPQLVGTYLSPGVGFPRSSWHNEKQKPR